MRTTIEMAREAAGAASDWALFREFMPEIHKLAELVRADERARMAEQPAQQEPVGCEGAVVNGRVYADRLEHDYKFECEAGPLHMCTDWVEFRRCFEWLAQHTAPPAQRTWVGLSDGEIEEILADHIDDPYAVAFTVNHKLKEKNA